MHDPPTWLHQFRIAYGAQRAAGHLDSYHPPSASQFRAEIEGWLGLVADARFARDEAASSFASTIGNIRTVLAADQPNVAALHRHLDAAATIVLDDSRSYLSDSREIARRFMVLAAARSVVDWFPDDGVNAPEVASWFGLSVTAAERLLEGLEDAGYLDRRDGTHHIPDQFTPTSAAVELVEQKLSPEPPSEPLEPASKVAAWDLDLTWVSDQAMREVLEPMVVELARAQAGGLYLATIVLAGAIGEGLLYHALVLRKVAAEGTPSAPRHNNGKGPVKDLVTEQWNFTNYINAARDLSLIQQVTRAAAHEVLREFRNLIHPKVQLGRGSQADDPEARASVAWLDAVARDLRNAPPP